MIKISVITPFYNGSRYVSKCIENIQEQSYKGFEHIIVDDGSAESEHKFISDAIAKYPNVILVSQKNRGQASAVNAGIKMAKGEYIAFCDQDDWWLSEKLQKQIAYLESHPGVDMVYSDAYLGDEKGSVLEKTWMQSRRVVACEGGYDNCVVNLFRRNFVCAPLVMLIRKNVFDKIGLMREAYTSAYDYDFLFRYFEGGHSVGFIDQSLAVWRMHAGQESENIRKAKRFQLGILYNFLLRRPNFILKHPILIAQKGCFTMVGLFLNKSRYLKTQDQLKIGYFF